VVKRIRRFSRLRARLVGGEAGLGLVEVMVAILVLTLGVLSLASGAVQSLASLGESRPRQQGTAAATRSLETVRSYSYELIALRNGQAPAGTTFDPDGSGPLAAETAVRTLTGAVTADVHQATTAGVTVTTWVTAYDDPALSGTSNARRVTAVASWTRGGVTKVVRESTVVGEAARGQTAAAFSIAPSAAQTRTIAAESPDPTCFAHTITNNGGSDRYDVALPTVGGYEVFAYGDSNGDGAGAIGERLVDLSGDGRPDTPSAVSHIYPLLICYRPLGAGTTVSASVTVGSTVDPTVARTVSHALSLTPSPTPAPSPTATPSPTPTPNPGASTKFYLHDPNVTANHDRTLGTVYAMNTTAPTATTLYDYDRNQDPDDLPGIYYKKAEASYDGIWQYQYLTATTLTGQSDLVLYLSWRDAILQNKTDLRNVRIKVTVQRMAANGTTVNETLVNGVSIAAPHAQAGWKQLTVNLTLPTVNFNFAANEYLRLRIGCASASDVDCLMAYDTTAYPSSFTVRTP
jgi:Tfp pilus assembly protein PilV